VTGAITLGPVRFDAPVLASIDPWALLLAAGAIAAIFWIRASVITTLLATSAAGGALFAFGLVG
jgi:chromate transporter